MVINRNLDGTPDKCQGQLACPCRRDRNSRCRADAGGRRIQWRIRRSVDQCHPAAPRRRKKGWGWVANPGRHCACPGLIAAATSWHRIALLPLRATELPPLRRKHVCTPKALKKLALGKRTRRSREAPPRVGSPRTSSVRRRRYTNPRRVPSAACLPVSARSQLTIVAAAGEFHVCLPAPPV